MNSKKALCSLVFSLTPFLCKGMESNNRPKPELWKIRPERKGFNERRIFNACREHTRLEELEQTLRYNPDFDLNFRDDYGKTPLFVAASLGIAQLLVYHNAQINVTDDRGWTPLLTHISFTRNPQSLALIDFLITNKADVNAIPHNGGPNPLYQAAKSNNEKLVKMLIDNKAHVTRHSLKYNPLLAAIREGNPKTIYILLNNGAQVTDEMRPLFEKCKDMQSILTLLKASDTLTGPPNKQTSDFFDFVDTWAPETQQPLPDGITEQLVHDVFKHTYPLKQTIKDILLEAYTQQQ